MLFQFGNVAVFLLVGFGFVFASLLMGSLLRPKVPTAEKLAPYECGETPTTEAWTNFNVRFYILALIFIIFDVEIAFMFPVAVVFRQWIKDGVGLWALAEIGVFVFILALGLVYAWVKGDLEWVKKILISNEAQGTKIMSRASRVP